MDPNEYRIVPVRASGEDIQEETVYSLAKQYRSVAAIKDWDAFEHSVGGAPMLIENGIPFRDFSREQTLESFLENRYP